MKGTHNEVETMTCWEPTCIFKGFPAFWTLFHTGICQKKRKKNSSSAAQKVMLCGFPIAPELPSQVTSFQGLQGNYSTSTVLGSLPISNNIFFFLPSTWPPLSSCYDYKVFLTSSIGFLRSKECTDKKNWNCDCRFEELKVSSISL